MAVNVPGLLSVVVFYLAILGTGLWASKKAKKEERKCTGNQSEITMVGGRNLSIWVSILTTTATWIGGGFLLGTAEVIYLPNRGLSWAIAPIGYSLNLIVAGLFFVKPVHKKNYVTVMDPFQEKYGAMLTSVLFIPSLLADIFWVACILAALGGTMSVILDISSPLAIVVSAAVAILYTLLGGLYSVAYTDVVQLILMLLGLCPPYVSIAGIGAVAAAVMSSIDSVLLSASSLFARNIYKNIIRRKKASEREIQCVLKLSILLFGLMGASLAMSTSSVYMLWYLSGDIMYSVVCAQLLAIFFLPSHANGYGSAAGFGTGLVLRCLAGEPLLGIPPLLVFPGCRLRDGVQVQAFPFRTAVMFTSLAAIVLVSRLASVLFLGGLLPERWDVFELRGQDATTLRDVAQKEVTEDSSLNVG